MAIVSKSNIDGIDIAINGLQQIYYSKLLAFWNTNSTYTMYPRANKNYKENDIRPEVSLDQKDYDSSLYNDKVSVNSFFLGADNRVYEYSNSQFRQNISLIFQADLVKLYGSNERLDEVFNSDVMRVISVDNVYMVGDITITEGIDNVYSDLTFSTDFKDKIKHSDISNRHVVKFSFDVIYKLKCTK